MDTMENITLLDDSAEYPMIGQGNTAEIFDYADGIVLKLFREQMPFAAIKREWERSRLIGEKFSDTPRTFELVRYRNRSGILYEKLTGADLSEQAIKHPLELKRYSRLLADIHVTMHKVDINLGCDIKDKLRNDITYAEGLTDSEKQKLVGMLEKLPAGSRLCHGDFHLGNIMSSGEKNYVIDWMTASSGDPAADVARSILLMKTGEPMNVSPFLRLVIHCSMLRMIKPYFRRYSKQTGMKYESVRAWMVPIAAARLSEWLTEHEREKLLRFIRKNI